MGIPQIAIPSEDSSTGTSEGDLSCKSDPVLQAATYPPQVGATNYKVPDTIYKAGATREYTDGTYQQYSAIDYDNFQNMKQVFKADEVVACLPAGTEVVAGSDPAKCCTGFINGETSRCALPDFVDVSVYTNRYVSSEAKKMNSSLFDDDGYLKDPSYVVQLACEKRMCASNTLAFGVLISKLKTPGQESVDAKTYRFLEGNLKADDMNGLQSLFNKGLKLNSHAYCVPQNVAGQATDDLIIRNCSN